MLRKTKLVCSVCDGKGRLVGPNFVVSDSARILVFFWFQLAFPPVMPCCRIRTYGSRCLVGVVRSAKPSIPENSAVKHYLVDIVSIRDQTWDCRWGMIYRQHCCFEVWTSR
jgi:hypothetical protein